MTWTGINLEEGDWTGVDLPSGGASASSHVPFITGAAVAVTNPGAGDVEFNQNRRTPADLRGRLQVRMYVAGAANGFTGAVAVGKYSTDGGTNFTALAADGVGPTVAIDNLAAGVTVYGAWFDLAEGAKADVILSAFLRAGNGVADPSLSTAVLEFRSVTS